MPTRKILALLAVAALAACGEDAKKIATGSVSGRAVYSTGSDNSGISVTVAGFSATTDAGGNYSFAEVPTGAQVVIAAAPNSVERTQTAAVTVSGATAVPDLTFTQVIPLKGVASAVAGGAVTVQLDPPNGPSTTVDGSGNFSFANATAGAHALRFSSPTLSSVDTIPQVLYLPGLGTFVVDTTQQNQLYQFPPFQLAAGRRLARARFFGQIFFGTFPPGHPASISADSQVAIASEFNSTVCCSTDNLYVANPATGEQVLVTDKLLRFPTSPARIAPDSRTIVYQTTEANNPLFSVAVTGLAPLTLGTPQKIGENVGRWEFSPQNQNTSPVVLATGSPPPGGTPTAFYAVRADTGAIRGGPFADPVGDFFVAAERRRVIFARNTAGAQSIFTADCSQETLGTPAVVEAMGGAYNWQSLGFSKDQGLFAYRVTTHPVPANVGMRVVANNGSAVNATSWVGAGSVPAAADASGLLFAPDNSRVLFASGGALFRRQADGSAAGVNLGASPSAWGFSADSTKILYDVAVVAPNRELRLANADGSGTPTVLEGPSAFFNAGVAADATAAVWHKSDGAGATQFWVRRGLLTATPPAAKLVDTNANLIGSFGLKATSPLYRKVNASFNWDLYALGANDVPTLVGVNWNFDQFVNSDGSKVLVSFFTNSFLSNGTSSAKIVNLATGSSTALLDRFAGPVGFLPGTPEKVLLYRQGTGNPYAFQDGAYLTDLP